MVIPEQTVIHLQIGHTRFPVALYDSTASRSLFSVLPQTISMYSWGNEYYGELPITLDYAGDKLQDIFQPGEIALWPEGNAICVFFGPTPISHADECRMASDGVALGKIIGDFSSLKRLRNQLGYVRLLSSSESPVVRH